MKHFIIDYEDGTLGIRGTCPITQKQWYLIVDEDGYRAWESGVLIQNALPNLTSDERELLITGITQEGWAITFGDKE